jgi:hypothetical protein
LRAFLEKEGFTRAEVVCAICTQTARPILPIKYEVLWGTLANRAIMCAAYQDDKLTGQRMYGYVQDSCADNNYWCQQDKYHLDISKPYLDSQGWTSGWNGRKLNWKYMNEAPAECALTS